MTPPTHRAPLIVGAGSGLSASLARLFAGEGMRVGLSARDARKLASLGAETGADTFTCGATQPDHVARLCEAAAPGGPGPGGVVYTASGRPRGPLRERGPAAAARG